VDIDIQTILSQNITLVYDALDLRVIDGGKLKQLVESRSRPMVMDTPGIIVAVYPPEPTLVQIGDNRIRITLQKHSDEIGGIPLWQIAANCNQLVPEPTPNLIAFGFNYDIVMALVGRDAYEVVMNLFIPDPTIIAEATEGKLMSFIPRIRYQRGQTQYDLALEPLDQQRVKVHMNAHFGFEGVALPPQDQLRALFEAEYEYLTFVLQRMFKGVK